MVSERGDGVYTEGLVDGYFGYCRSAVKLLTLVISISHRRKIKVKTIKQFFTDRRSVDQASFFY